MGKVYLTNEFTFDAAHRLHNYDGKCGQTHGHTYKLQVTICGEPNKKTGLLVDFNDLKGLVDSAILKKVDHKDLTEYFDLDPFFKGMNTTVENLIVWCWTVMEHALPAFIRLYEIKLWETPTCYATYRGGG